MSRYVSAEAAAADGITVAHRPEEHRFVLVFDGHVIGEAHYQLADTRINFDHTVVIPEFRGTGLSEVLAMHALTSPLAAARETVASCWFIEGVLRRNPHLRAGTDR